jgi:hypothetical protein
MVKVAKEKGQSLSSLALIIDSLPASAGQSKRLKIDIAEPLGWRGLMPSLYSPAKFGFAFSSSMVHHNVHMQIIYLVPQARERSVNRAYGKTQRRVKKAK